MKRVESDMYAFTCYVALWNFSLVFTRSHQIGRKFRKKKNLATTKNNPNHIHRLPSSINLLLLSMIFSQQLSVKVLYPL